jgi:hypothetical protein
MVTQRIADWTTSLSLLRANLESLMASVQAEDKRIGEFLSQSLVSSLVLFENALNQLAETTGQSIDALGENDEDISDSLSSITTEEPTWQSWAEGHAASWLDSRSGKRAVGRVKNIRHLDDGIEIDIEPYSIRPEDL